MEIYRVSRKSRALGTGIPRCVSGMGAYSLNPVRGCLMACAYCAYRALPSSPPDDEIYVYEDIAEQLREELDRMDRSGHRPSLVLLNTGADCFMGVAEVDRIASDCLEILLKRKIPVQITTKGNLPRELLTLLARHPERVRVWSSIPATSPEFYSRYEPNAPGLAHRLATIKALTRAGIDTRVKIEPLIPTENDAEAELEDVLRSVYRTGVRRFSASYLQMRLGVEKRLRARIGPMRTNLIAQWYRRKTTGDRPDLDDGIERSETLPPREHRLESYRVLWKLARNLRMGMSICSCRNPDIHGGACYEVPERTSSGPGPRKQLDLL
ncbi:MAG: radical SAM protein [Pseudomonadota bacterium]